MVVSLERLRPVNLNVAVVSFFWGALWNFDLLRGKKRKLCLFLFTLISQKVLINIVNLYINFLLMHHYFIYMCVCRCTCTFDVSL